MRVEMRDGVLHASIHAEHAQTAELVRDALDDLRARLDADGVRSGQFTVDAQGAGTRGPRPADRDAAPARRRRRAATTDPIVVTRAAATTTSVTSDSLLDVRI